MVTADFEEKHDDDSPLNGNRDSIHVLGQTSNEGQMIEVAAYHTSLTQTTNVRPLNPDAHANVADPYSTLVDFLTEIRNGAVQPGDVEPA